MLRAIISFVSHHGIQHTVCICIMLWGVYTVTAYRYRCASLGLSVRCSTNKIQRQESESTLGRTRSFLQNLTHIFHLPKPLFIFPLLNMLMLSSLPWYVSISMGYHSTRTSFFSSALHSPHLTTKY
ncbi:hypothetical protein DFH08DRAFT_839654, partial [Mycena albidolilacea]